MEPTTTVHDCCVGFNIGPFSMRVRLNKGPFRHQNIKILFSHNNPKLNKYDIAFNKYYHNYIHNFLVIQNST